MIIKKYVGKTESEATEEAKRELGPNIVVMTVKPVKKTGFFSLFQPQKIEVTVGLEEETERPQRTFSPQNLQRAQAKKIVPSEDNIYDWRMLLNMNISISGSDATVKADWYRNYTLVPGTLQQFSVYDAENDEDIVYTGTFDSNPKEKTLVVQDKEHSPEKKYEFNGGGNIDTIKIERFFEKDGVQYGVGVVYGNDGEAIARITMVQ